MYKEYQRYNKNGYVIINIPNHPRAFDPFGDNRPEDFCVYEHILIMEEILDRPLKEGEVVHHLDGNKANNSPDNLMVLINPMHGKLHGWLNKNIIISTPDYSERKDLGCVRCCVCEKPTYPDQKYCSTVCVKINNASPIKPSKEILEQEVKEFPMTILGVKYGVSDNAVRKWCKAYEIELPDMRGHWTKKKFEKV